MTARRLIIRIDKKIRFRRTNMSISTVGENPFFQNEIISRYEALRKRRDLRATRCQNVQKRADNRSWADVKKMKTENKTTLICFEAKPDTQIVGLVGDPAEAAILALDPAMDRGGRLRKTGAAPALYSEDPKYQYREPECVRYVAC